VRSSIFAVFDDSGCSPRKRRAVALSAPAHEAPRAAEALCVRLDRRYRIKDSLAVVLDVENLKSPASGSRLGANKGT
jgi:hypothetical protein